MLPMHFRRGRALSPMVAVMFGVALCGGSLWWEGAAFGQIIITEIIQNPSAVGDSAGEWFELHNAGTSAVDMNGWKIKDDSSTSETHTISKQGGLSIPAGGYIVLALNGDSNANGGVTADYDYSAISLGNSTDGLVLTNAADVEQDRVVWDNGSTFPDPNGASMALKTDGHGNYLDNSVGANWCESQNAWAGSAGDSGTPGAANDCMSGPTTFTGAIYEIQGNGAASPHVAALATAEDNVVTAVGAGGFFIQTPTASSDNDPDTSDGIFVLYDGTLTVAVGDQVDVTGTVEESFGFTRLDATVEGGAVSVDASNQPLPAPVEFGATRPSLDPANPSCAIEYECYEGMLIRVATGMINSPSQYFRSDPVAEMYVTATGARAFREKGLEYPGDSMHPGVPVWDGNPELFELDPDKLGLANEAWVPGTTFTATGVLGYEFSGYELWPTELSATTAAPALPYAVRERAEGEVSVASLNMLNFDRDASSYGTKRDKLSQYILDVLRAPDIIGVQEVFSLAALEGLSAEIARDDPDVRYRAYLEVGNRDPGINVAFLVRSGVTVQAVTQHGKSETYLNPSTNMQDLLHDRPPLRLDAAVGGLEFSVVVVHNRSLISIETARVQAKRLAQAQSVARLAQSLQDRKLIVVGDFNAFQFTDGYVDVIGQISGNVTASENISSGPDLVDPNLTNLIERVPAAQRYSYSFRNSAQVLDHALVNEQMLPSVVGMGYARGNVDAPAREENNIDSPLRASDHDGFVVWLSAPGRRDPGGGGGGGEPPVASAEADLRLSAVRGSGSSGRVRFIVTAENSGPDVARGVVVSSSVSGPAASTQARTVGCKQDPDGLPDCALGDVAAGESASFTVDFAAGSGSGGSVGYTGSVRSATQDPNPGNNEFTISEPLGPPKAPSELSATAVGATEIRLRWRDNSDTETGFAVYQQGPGDSKLRLIGTVAANRASVVVDELVPGITYGFAVEARNGLLASARTPKVEATTWFSESARCGEADVLCLGSFEVEVEWDAGDGNAGRGVAERLTARSGDFWFFGPDNIEMVVKVLDGCAINGHMWVFAAGVTDLEVTMTVRDTGNGKERAWSSPSGTRFQPILDKEAFASCVAPYSVASGDVVVLSGASPGLRTEPEPEPVAASGAVGALSEAACAASDTALCLRDGRYEVRADWRVGEKSGSAHGFRRTADTGLFWFFSADNVELIVKVLDACEVNGHRWVLMGGLTDVVVDISVTDSETEETRMYGAPGGTPFPTLFDLKAFSCNSAP